MSDIGNCNCDWGVRTIVLKFGGSVLASEESLPAVVHEIHRWRRDGWRVVAVVSALGGVTDRLLAQANRYCEADEQTEARAALLATGEATSAALLGLALSKAGIAAHVADAARIELLVQGPGEDALPVQVSREKVRRLLEETGLVVVPGFIGIGADGATALLGRGGSDLTAIFLAERLVSAGLRARCRLIKDVDGLYEWDPALARTDGRQPRRFARLGWEDALRLDGRIVQHKAVAFARDRGLEFEVAGLNQCDATCIGRHAIEWAGQQRGGEFGRTRPAARRLRIGLLGLGTVGKGVWERVRRLEEDFEIVSVAVARPERHNAEAPEELLTGDAREAIASECDVLVETIGGITPARELIAEALTQGIAVVTANKAVVAAHGEDLTRLAAEHEATLAYSAAAGGVTPILENIAGLRAEGVRIRKVEGVVNGTSNYILNRIAAGESFAAALAEAQRRGYAEADPAADIEGADAAAKGVLMAHAAFGRWVAMEDVEVQGIGGLGAELIERARRTAGVIRLAAEAEEREGRVRISVAPCLVTRGDALFDVPGAWNRVVIHTAEAGRVTLSGKGAGRWPTAESIVGDLLRLRREGRSRATRARRPVTQRAEEVLAS